MTPVRRALFGSKRLVRAARRRPRSKAIAATCLLTISAMAFSDPVYQPPGVNLTYGAVSHGQRIQSATSNPAAAAARLAETGKGDRGVVLSGSAGLEYGNLENLFDFYDRIANGYEPSDPDTGGGGPGQEPEEKPDDGIDLGDIRDSLDPDVQETIEAVGQEVATQLALLGVIRNEGYARAWLSADVPFQMGRSWLGGAWTFDVNFSGSSKSFGVTESIDFDSDAAISALRAWLDTVPENRPEFVSLSEQVQIRIDSATNRVNFVLRNDSSLVSKSTRLTDISAGYSNLAWTTDHGNLFIGVEGHVYLMQLSRYSVRFGDITDSDELFQEIRDANFDSDTRLGVDLGALWVANNYQLGIQVANLNEPTFEFPTVNLEPYRSVSIINFLQQDRTYKMDSQVRLEGAIYTTNRRWTVYAGVDVDPATDPLGDDYQWATLSAAYIDEDSWLPNIRVGLRENLAGTRMRYISAGVTLFKVVNVDLASAFESVKIDGDELPQGLMASVGFQITW